jgi:hypothetical protein
LYDGGVCWGAADLVWVLPCAVLLACAVLSALCFLRWLYVLLLEKSEFLGQEAAAAPGS